MNIEIGGDTFTKKPNILEEIAYRDTWGWRANSLIAMIHERLVLMRDLLAEAGSIYVHCDPRINSYIRLVSDEVFGKITIEMKLSGTIRVAVAKKNFSQKSTTIFTSIQRVIIGYLMQNLLGFHEERINATI